LQRPKVALPQAKVMHEVSRTRLLLCVGVRNDRLELGFELDRVLPELEQLI
jgi:hypothetical protein